MAYDTCMTHVEVDHHVVNNQFGGDEAAATADILDIFSGMDAAFSTGIGYRITISNVITHTSSATEGWTTGRSISTLLSSFSSFVYATYSGICHVHLWTRSRIRVNDWRGVASWMVQQVWIQHGRIVVSVLEQYLVVGTTNCAGYARTRDIMQVLNTIRVYVQTDT